MSFAIVLVVSLSVGIIAYLHGKASVEVEWGKKWRLGVCNDSEGWHPLLERHLGSYCWEYIYINKENLPLISHIAYSKVLSVGPLISNPFQVTEMIQDMVNRGHGSIAGVKRTNKNDNWTENRKRFFKTENKINQKSDNDI